MMRRADFLLLSAAALAPRAAAAQSDADPAISSQRPALRVLLGQGDAIATSPQSFSFNGVPYRGTFARLADGRIVDVVDLEEYLYSVVTQEMPTSWPAAALQAQAICARTYVLQRSDPRRPYDLVPSELDQVYRGMSAESPAASAAVDATRGRVLSFSGAFAQIAYSSCCGGHTESSADAWGNVPFPYLQGVVCTWCAASPRYRWTANLSLDVIGARSASLAPLPGRLTDVRIAERDGSGRTRTFQLITDRGDVSVPGGVFRRAVGSRVLPSLLLTDVHRDGDSLQIAGGGLGHGVGLCQWGAKGMALARHAPEEILAFYFPGTQITSS